MTHARYLCLQAALRLQQPTDMVPFYTGLLSCGHHITGRPVVTNEDFAHARTQAERDNLVAQAIDDYIQTAETLNASLIMVYAPFHGEDHIRTIQCLRQRVDGQFMVGSWVAGGVHCIPDGANLERFCYRLADEPDKVHEEARGLLKAANEWGRRCAEAGSEILILANDVAFNQGPFLSPARFAEFVAPYLNEHVAFLKKLGVWVVFHSDGDLMPIIDQIVDSGVHGLNPIDPMAGMDIAEVKRRYGHRVTLLGNVQCDLIHRGPRSAIRESARYCLQSAKAGGGYVYVPSSEVFVDTPWENVMEMVNAWKEWGCYAS